MWSYDVFDWVAIANEAFRQLNEEQKQGGKRIRMGRVNKEDRQDDKKMENVINKEQNEKVRWVDKFIYEEYRQGLR